VILLLLPRFAFACRALGPFDPADKKLAEVVFEGEAAGYELLPGKRQAKVTFRVTKTLRGEEKKEWVVLYGSNINSAPPASLRAFLEKYGKKNEVGFRRQEKGLPKLVQGACNPPYVLRLQ
jgi:hypothetical protein